MTSTTIPRALETGQPDRALLTLAPLARQLTPQIELHKFRQFLFFYQWDQLREYAHRRGIRFIGDMPIFIAGDSSDAWSRPELFLLDDHRRRIDPLRLPVGGQRRAQRLRVQARGLGPEADEDDVV